MSGLGMSWNNGRYFWSDDSQEWYEVEIDKETRQVVKVEGGMVLTAEEFAQRTTDCYSCLLEEVKLFAARDITLSRYDLLKWLVTGVCPKVGAEELTAIERLFKEGHIKE